MLRTFEARMMELVRQMRILLAGLAAAALMAAQPLHERVLVVHNHAGFDSAGVAKHYVSKRGIPGANRCKIDVEPLDTIKEETYISYVRAPIRKCLEKAGKQKILYIVLAHETPYAVTLQEGRGVALDQLLADIWDEYTGLKPGFGAPPHPYFGYAQSKSNSYAPFLSLADYRAQPGALNLYSVWRLDAADAKLAKGLVDKALQAEKEGLKGKACFDLQHGKAKDLPDSGVSTGDWDLHRAATFAREAGFEVLEDELHTEFGTPPSGRCDGAALYAGWYSLNRYNDAFTWNTGAIGFHIDSASAANPRGGANWSANAIQKGITLTSGAVGEPYLEGLPHPDQVFLYLLEGANAGDAFLRGTRWLKWMVINIGDPLYRPFPGGRLKKPPQ